MDAILGQVFPVLDKGHIRVIDYMGDMDAIVQAARVSYGKGTKTVSEDEHLIRYLMRKRHTTPYEMCELKLHVRMPMDHWRQQIRHRTASVNEYSTRYSEAIDDKQEVLPGQWRLQATSNKQGSSGLLADKDPAAAQMLTDEECLLHEQAEKVYKQRLECGVAREQARKDLPLSTYTEAYWKIDLHNLLGYLSLRMDGDAQLEIRSYANVVGEQILAIWIPTVWKAFLDYRKNAMFLSALDIVVISKILGDAPASAVAHAKDYGWLKDDFTPKKKSRERKEFEAKAKRLGIQLPW
jgi:thymidylate synthase (FAD)